MVNYLQRLSFSRAWHFKAFIQNKWLFLLCACFVMAINLGFSLSFGVLFVDILEELNETRAITAAIQSVHAAVVLLSGWYEFDQCHFVKNSHLRTISSIGYFVKTYLIM